MNRALDLLDFRCGQATRFHCVLFAFDASEIRLFSAQSGRSFKSLLRHHLLITTSCKFGQPVYALTIHFTYMQVVGGKPGADFHYVYSNWDRFFSETEQGKLIFYVKCWKVQTNDYEMWTGYAPFRLNATHAFFKSESMKKMKKNYEKKKIVLI